MQLFPYKKMQQIQGDRVVRSSQVCFGEETRFGVDIENSLAWRT